jgi:hypothetical protein
LLLIFWGLVRATPLFHPAVDIIPIGAYGEAEFIFASIKVLTVVGLIVGLFLESIAIPLKLRARSLGLSLILVGVQIMTESVSGIGKNLDRFSNIMALEEPKDDSLDGGPSWYDSLHMAHCSYSLAFPVHRLKLLSPSLVPKSLPSLLVKPRILAETYPEQLSEFISVSCFSTLVARRLLVRSPDYYTSQNLGMLTINLGLLVPSNDEMLSNGKKGTAAASPFVIA